jgi:hypothetical protein
MPARGAFLAITAAETCLKHDLGQRLAHPAMDRPWPRTPLLCPQPLLEMKNSGSPAPLPGSALECSKFADCPPHRAWSRRKFLAGMAAYAAALRGVVPRGFAADGAAEKTPSRDTLVYYSRTSAMDDGGAHQDFLAGLPAEPGELVAAIQGMVLHQHWAPAYGETLTAERHQEPHLRSAHEMLVCLNSRTPLEGGARPPAKRLVGVCRHFTLLSVAALRAHGIPARARCGFAGYFAPGKFEDHWVVEYWSDRETRWRLVDAQLDDLQRKTLRIGFDPLDVPRDRFVVAGRAWQMCRNGEASPDQFGLSFLKEYGIWFVANNLVRDVAALNKMEMLPWDVWGVMAAPNAAIASETASAFDEVARYSLEPDVHFNALQERYRSDPRFTVPPTVTNAIRGAVERVPAGHN